MSKASLRPVNRRVLFVDDEPNVRAAFLRLASRDGFGVDLAGSGVEALSLAERRAYAAIVTDLAMPGMDGATLIQRLRRLQEEATYIAVTGLRQADPVYQRVLCETDLVVFRKPWDGAELLEAVRRAVHGAPSASSAPAGPSDGVRVLLLEDNPGDAELFTHALKDAMQADCTIVHKQTLGEAISAVQPGGFDVAVVDLSLPDATDLQSVLALQAAAPSMPVVVLTGSDDDGTAFRAVRSGAQDYLVKGQTARSLLRRAIFYSIERKQAEQHLIRMAQYDPLTGLANRSLFRDRLAHALARGRRRNESFAVLALDLDHFKPVNDAFGHAAGDGVLRQVAAALTDVVRQSDTVARLGGDEFAVLLEPPSRRADVISVCERLLEALAAPHDLGQDRVVVTCSIGVAVYPAAGDSADLLLKAADGAMYRAKRCGRNRYHVLGGSPRAPRASCSK